MKEQQQVTARQLQQQQKAQRLASDSPEVQQSALANASEEVAGYGDEEESSAAPRLGPSLEAPGGGEMEAMPADTSEGAVFDQSVSQLSAADPAEVSSQNDPEPMVETPAPPRLSEAAELSVDERIDVFLEAIRNRSWEQTNSQPVKWADGAKPDIQLPPSGYSEIGGIGSSKIKGQMLNPGRTFYPGQAYEPEVRDPLLCSGVCFAPCSCLDHRTWMASKCTWTAHQQLACLLCFCFFKFHHTACHYRSETSSLPEAAAARSQHGQLPLSLEC